MIKTLINTILLLLIATLFLIALPQWSPSYWWSSFSVGLWGILSLWASTRLLDELRAQSAVGISTARKALKRSKKEFWPISIALFILALLITLLFGDHFLDLFKEHGEPGLLFIARLLLASIIFLLDANIIYNLYPACRRGQRFRND